MFGVLVPLDTHRTIQGILGCVACNQYSASALICVFPLVVYEREISTLKAKLDEANCGLEHYKKISHAQAREIEEMKKNYEEARVATLLAGMWNIHTPY